MVERQVEMLRAEGIEIEPLDTRQLLELEPNLAPDTSKLLVLSLPLRSREYVYRQFDLSVQKPLNRDENACFEYLPDAYRMRIGFWPGMRQIH